MEGISGVVHNAHTNWPGGDYERARGWMVRDVNAAIEGALAGGATEIVVNDAHESMRNLIIEDLHPAAQLVSGHSKPVSMMWGIDSSFAAALLVGYHARVGDPQGVINHTYSGAIVTALRLNGREMGEVALSAAVAGHFRVPVGLVTGDSAVVREAQEALGDIETVAVKEGIGRYAALCLHPTEARKRIRAAAERALRRAYELRPVVLTPPVELELRFPRTPMADECELIPHVRRVDGFTVSYRADDVLQAYKLLQALVELADAAMPKK